MRYFLTATVFTLCILARSAMAQCDDSARDEHGLLRHLPFLGRVCGECNGGDAAFTVEPVYYGEVFTNTRGGISTSGATQYEGSIWQ
jgi:hypothetical protein